MNTGVIELLVFGLVAIISGIFVIISLVRELAPEERRKWLLGIGLGSGVITFSLKIALIVIFSTFPQLTIESLPERKLKHKASINLANQPANYLQNFQTTAYRWEALPETAPFPINNPPTSAKIALGKKLFFDTRLSADGSLSCASCHELSTDKAGGDGLPHSIGIHGQEGTRNAPTVLNAAFQRVLFWDGRARSLEDQAKGPLTNPIEMGMPSLRSVEEKLRAIPDYRQAFAKVFKQEPSLTIENITKAIASYERTLITPDAPYDRFVKGESNALSRQQIRGMALFEKTGCITCHSGPNFSDASFYSDGPEYRIFPAVPDTEFETRFHLSQDRGLANDFPNSDRGVWRIPSLRNVSRTTPYFHNGSVADLEQAVRVMARVQLNKRLSNSTTDDQNIFWSNKDKKLSVLNDLALSDEEIKDIVAFLESLASEPRASAL